MSDGKTITMTERQYLGIDPLPGPDWERMREAGRRAAEERERRIFEAVFGDSTEEELKRLGEQDD